MKNAELENVVQDPRSDWPTEVYAVKKMQDIPSILFIYTDEYLPESNRVALTNVCAIDSYGQYYVMKGSAPSEEGAEWVLRLREDRDSFYIKFEDKLGTDKTGIWDWYQMYTEMADDENNTFCDEIEDVDLREVHQIKIYGVRYDEEKNPVCDLFYTSAGDRKAVCDHENAQVLADWIMTNMESIRQKTDGSK